jgi:hypothetical protein
VASRVVVDPVAEVEEVVEPGAGEIGDAQEVLHRRSALRFVIL